MDHSPDNSIVQSEKLLIIACSAGGVNLLLELLQVLKKNTSYAVLAIVHRNNRYQSSLEEMAQNRCTLPVKQVEEKESILPGVVYFAPAAYHVLIEENKTFSLDVSEPINYCRPSIDVSMQSAAEVFKQDLIAILLSGANRDGAEGMFAVRKFGGTTLVQDPHEAEVDLMPKSAIEIGGATSVLSNVAMLAYCADL